MSMLIFRGVIVPRDEIPCFENIISEYEFGFQGWQHIKLIVPRVEQIVCKKFGFLFKGLSQIMTNLWMFDWSSLHIDVDVPRNMWSAMQKKISQCLALQSSHVYVVCMPKATGIWVTSSYPVLLAG